MKILGQFLVHASRPVTWQTLMDPDTLCSLAASCEEARQLDATHYEGVIRARLAVVTLRARVRGTVVAMDAPCTLTVIVEGSSSGMPGTFHGRTHVELTEAGEMTRVEYRVEVDILGRLGTLGEGFFQMTAQRIATKFAQKLSRHLADEG
jgi:carbon monoxide dehydrogenase subunit G